MFVPAPLPVQYVTVSAPLAPAQPTGHWEFVPSQPLVHTRVHGHVRGRAPRAEGVLFTRASTAPAHPVALIVALIVALTVAGELVIQS